MKLIKIIAAVLITNVILSSQIALAGKQFTDLSETHRNYTAINYLTNKGIINGYPNNTIRLNRYVSRAEFLKLTIESSGIEASATEAALYKEGFLDVDYKAWYGKYVYLAEQEKWIKGYAGNIFKPEQTVNKAEGLQIIAKIQTWKKQKVTEKPFDDVNLNLWFTGITSYAKSKNFLEEQTGNFRPEMGLSRAKASEILFRTLITKETNSDIFSSDLINQVEIPATTNSNTVQITLEDNEEKENPVAVVASTPVQDFENVSYQTYSLDFFNNITLNENLPNIFYLNEVYYLEGKISGEKTYKETFAFLQNENEEFTNYLTDVNNNSFKIPIIFRETGNYNLGIILGTSGESKIIPISVLPSLPTSTSNESSAKPSNQTIQYTNEKTTFNWENTNNFSKLTIFQNDQTKSFFFRQNKKSFDISYKDFKDFEEGFVYFQIEGANGNLTNGIQITSNWTVSDTRSFNAVMHHFSEVKDDAITYSTLPEKQSVPGNISFSGKVKTDIFAKAGVIKPDGLVEEFDLNTTGNTGTYVENSIITNGSDYTLNFTTKISGIYIIEINEKLGSAVINIPIYVGSIIPFIPDFTDIEDTAKDPESLSVLKNKLLNLINEEREKVGVSKVSRRDDIDVLAQNHTDDMVNRDFFSHINPDGLSPEDRRKALLIKTEIGENLAISPNLTYIHYGLMRSAIHRKNILEPKWTKVGIGLTLDSKGSLLAAEEFSIEPLTTEDLIVIRNDAAAKINAHRTSLGTSTFVKNTALELVADDWSQLMIDENFFGFSSTSGKILSTEVQKVLPNKSIQALILQSGSSDKLIDEIVSQIESLTNQFIQIGLGVKIDNLGTLNLTAIFSS